MCRSILPDCKPKLIKTMERKEDDKLVLYRGHSLFVMGAYEEEIWHLCDGEHSVNDIVDIVVNKYHVNREKALSEIAAFLNKLVERELMSL
ncbi:MAG: Coenzyme PQQ synthesis protein D [Methanosaeta sp. PtaU1.Bin112]|nr:MAG: Coenzyme PQQ synthesis protein D [Methanosaeta sp. PtaU1.Bin112]